MERSRGHRGETAQPLRQQPYGPVVQSSPTERWLWLEGLVSPVAVPLCGFSGEYEMRVVQGRARSRARSCCPEGEERVSPQAWVRCAGSTQGALSLLGEGTICCPLLAAFLCVSTPRGTYVSKVCESCLAAAPQSFNYLGPERSLVAGASCGVAALACGDTEQQQS